MPRIFVDNPLSRGEIIRVTGEDGHHFSRVLRAKPGERVAVASAGAAYLGTVDFIDSAAGTITVTIDEPLARHEPSVQVILIQGLAKGDKIDEILQKCTELGAAGFIVTATHRSVVQLDARKASARLSRWQRQVREAAGQSQRDIVPTVDYASSWSQAESVLRQMHPDLVLILDEDESALGLRGALTSSVRIAASEDTTPVVALLVGPEGGFADEERSWLKDHLSAKTVTLGPRILRTETAGPAAISAILYEYGDMGGR